MKKVLVVGGGISGLAAALELAQTPDVTLQLLEASGRLGGVLETIYEKDWLIERSADNFATLIPDALQLSEQFGLRDQLIQPNQHGRQAFVFVGNKLHPIPAGFSLMQPTRCWPILTTGALSLRGKLRLMREYWVPARKFAEPGITNGDPATFTNDDESLQSFATRRLGQEAFERLVEPIVSGIFTADPSTLSMAATMPQFLEMERSNGGLIRGYLKSKKKDAASAARRASGARYDQFMAPQHGMSHWVESLTSHLPDNCVRLRQSVCSILPSPANSSTDLPSWRVRTDAGEEFQADGVILATPSRHTAKIVAVIAPTAASLIDAIPYASSAVVAMIVERSQFKGRLDGFGVIVPAIEQRQALAISLTSNKYPGRTPDDQVLLRVFLGGALHPESMHLSDSLLEQIAAKEVREILGWSGGGLKWQAVIRWCEAMPQYLVGHVDRLGQINKLLAPLKSIQLCGAAFQGVGIPQCVRSGRQAARALKNLFQHA